MSKITNNGSTVKGLKQLRSAKNWITAEHQGREFRVLKDAECRPKYKT